MNTMRVIFFLHTLSACWVMVLSGTHPDGISKVSREQDASGNYKFSYVVSNPEGEHYREEGTDELKRVIGSYGMKHADGTHRVVEYVADQNGFRAEIHSNEPGVISSESADSSISKLHSELPLAVAATSEDKSAAAFGARLRADSSRVSYLDEIDNKPTQQKRLNNEPRELRQKSFEDYRPMNPTAYYPSGAVDTARPLRPPSVSATRVSPPKPATKDPSEESRPLDVYLPPINPHTAVGRPPYFVSRGRSLEQSPYATTSRRPYTPPYGGFDDDDQVPVNRRPGISMSTVHGGLGRDNLESPISATPSYGAGRYPYEDYPLSRDFLNPHFPPRSNFPPLPRLPGSPLSVPPRRVPGSVFRPPTYNVGLNPQNFVLKAVPIPNGIQAVRIDPETGRVYDRLIYPLYIRDGQPVYDRNVILNNNDDSDGAIVRNYDPNYFDIAFQRRPPFRSIRNPTLDLDEDFRNITRRSNQTFDPSTLSIPTARDLEWVRRQLSQVEGFDRTRFSNPSVYQNTQFENNEYPGFNDFDDSRDENLDTEGLYSRHRNSDYFDESFAREPRFFDRLTPEDTKEIASKSSGEAADVKTSETNPETSVAEKAR